MLVLARYDEEKRLHDVDDFVVDDNFVLVCLFFGFTFFFVVVDFVLAEDFDELDHVEADAINHVEWTEKDPACQQMYIPKTFINFTQPHQLTDVNDRHHIHLIAKVIDNHHHIFTPKVDFTEYMSILFKLILLPQKRNQKHQKQINRWWMYDELIVAMDIFEGDGVPFNVFVFIIFIVESAFFSHFTVNRAQNCDQIVKQENVCNVKMKYHETLMLYQVFFSDVILELSEYRVQHGSHAVEQVRVGDSAVLEKAHEEIAHDEEVQKENEQEVRSTCHHTVDCHQDIGIRLNNQHEVTKSQPGAKAHRQHGVAQVLFGDIVCDQLNVQELKEAKHHDVDDGTNHVDYAPNVVL